MPRIASYVIVPLLALSVLAAPLSQTSTAGVNTTSIPPAQSESTFVAENEALIEQLESAATAVDRLILLSDPSDHVYDFLNPPTTSAVTNGTGGHTVKADRKEFPALIGNSLSMTVGFLGPCGFNTPHTHPRSAEINIVVEGELGTEFVAENGAAVIRNRLSLYQMTVFPQGAIHTEWNPTCSPAVFVAGFASEDPGVQQSAQRLLDLDDDLLEAAFASDFTFAGEDIDTFRSLIPHNVALGVETCLQQCGLQKR